MSHFQKVIVVLTLGYLVSIGSANAQRIDELGGSRYSGRSYESHTNLFCTTDKHEVWILDILVPKNPTEPTMMGKLEVSGRDSYSGRRSWCFTPEYTYKFTENLSFELDRLEFTSEVVEGSKSALGIAKHGSFEVLRGGRSTTLAYDKRRKAVALEVVGAPLRSNQQLMSSAQRKKEEENDRRRKEEEARAARKLKEDEENVARKLKEDEETATQKRKEGEVQDALNANPDLVLSCKVISIRGAQTSATEATSSTSSNASNQGSASSSPDLSSDSGSSTSKQLADQRSHSTQESCAAQQGWQNLRLVMSVWTNIRMCNAEPCGITAAAINAKGISINRYTGQGSTECFVWQCEKLENANDARKF